MSDARRRYRAIHAALMQLFGNPTGHKARHVQVLTAMIGGIVGSTHTQTTEIAAHVPTMPGLKPKKAKKKHKKRTKKVLVTKKASLVTSIERWYKNEHITEEQYFLPLVDALLTAMVDRNRTIELVMDESAVGRNCVTLMVSITYHGRAIPIAWLVVTGKKGHLPEDLHLQLLATVCERMPATATRVVTAAEGTLGAYQQRCLPVHLFPLAKG